MYWFPFVLASVNPALWAPLGVILGAGITAIGAGLAAKRTTSGTITTSDAATLWNAYSNLQNRLVEEAERQRGEISDLRADNRLLRKRVADLESEIAGLRYHA